MHNFGTNHEVCEDSISGTIFWNESHTHKMTVKLPTKLWLLTSTSHKDLLEVAEVAVVRAVNLKKTFCFFLYSSMVKNFSCSAWKSRTTSPPLRILSMFSLCSRNNEIFHDVCEFTTLTCKTFIEPINFHFSRPAADIEIFRKYFEELKI